MSFRAPVSQDHRLRSEAVGHEALAYTGISKGRYMIWERMTTNKGGWPGTEKMMVALRGEARVGLDTPIGGQPP